MRYTITKINHTTYEISNERGQSTGTIKFDAWALAKAKATIADGEYIFHSPGFWQMKKEVTRNGIHFATIAPRIWKGIELIFENRPILLFKKKSVWGGGEYVVVDENGSTFASLTTTFSWKKFGFEYETEVHENMLDAELTNIMPFLLFYTARYMRIRQS